MNGVYNTIQAIAMQKVAPYTFKRLFQLICIHKTEKLYYRFRGIRRIKYFSYHHTNYIYMVLHESAQTKLKLNYYVSFINLYYIVSQHVNTLAHLYREYTYTIHTIVSYTLQGTKF